MLISHQSIYALLILFDSLRGVFFFPSKQVSSLYYYQSRFPSVSPRIFDTFVFSHYKNGLHNAKGVYHFWGLKSWFFRNGVTDYHILPKSRAFCTPLYCGFVSSCIRYKRIQERLILLYRGKVLERDSQIQGKTKLSCHASPL